MAEICNQKPQQHVQEILETLQKASKDLHYRPITFKFNSVSAIKALSELGSKAEADAILSNDPTLFDLSLLLSNLKTQFEKLEKSQGYSLRSIIKRHLTNFEISRVASLIEGEIQAWIHRAIVQNVVEKIEEERVDDEDEKIKTLIEFENLVSRDFDGDLQDLILKAKIFSTLESILCNSTSSMRIREQSSIVIASLVRFNKDVFVGLVLMGPITQTLISMASCKSIQVLSSLIKLIKSPLIDEIEANGEIVRIIRLLSSEDLSIRIAAMDCVSEIAYFGRKEAIEAMIEQRLIEKLLELQQRLEDNGGGDDDLIEMGRFDEEKNVELRETEKWVPFAGCVARFAVQLEVGEGLGERERERREFKVEILRRVREDEHVSDAEGATIVAEVLWGSSPMNFD